ncbi:MAG: HepT-like ribonuclease domain-containing protein [Geothrix sp.]|uniref:HepT-like ribonuclease domain-containing protein n=1 Tax=Geothrix sp. TaxID=1962974 RepID=UPI003BAF6988
MRPSAEYGSAHRGNGPLEFCEGWRAQAATLRNLENLGEAAKRLPRTKIAPHPEVTWKSIAGFRDFLADAHFGVDDQIVWNIITT